MEVTGQGAACLSKAAPGPPVPIPLGTTVDLGPQPVLHPAHHLGAKRTEGETQAPAEQSSMVDPL